MKLLFVTSECAPYSKSGGLADVANSLPPALKALDHEIEIVSPMYKCVKDRFMDQCEYKETFEVHLGNTTQSCSLFRTMMNGVPCWFIENDGLFYRDKLYGYDDDKYRFAWFSKAVIESMPKYDFVPEILHCNDWETALAVIYLKDDQARNARFRNIKSVYTIHNIAYQGQFGANEVTDTFGLDYGWVDGGLGYIYDNRLDCNLMKGAMLMADAVSTVSPTYARELHTPQFGKGLEGVCDIIEGKMYGILNGIDMDQYNPAINKNIIKNFSYDDKSGKAECKAKIQKMFGLKQEKRWPLIASVARLVEQKGIELIKEILPEIMNMGVQVIIFGQGDQKYIDYFEECTRRWPGQFGFSSNFSQAVSEEVFAGIDMYLMPSAFEPCGLSQMMAMRFGAIPIVHETGGLKDSIRPYSDFDGIGDGFSFSGYTSKNLLITINEAVKVYFAKEHVFETLRDRAMRKDFSWEKSAYAYEKMYSDIIGNGGDPNVTFQDAFDALVEIYNDLKPSRDKFLATQSDDYSCTVQVNISGAGQGTYYARFTKEQTDIQPYNYDDADVVVTASLDNLYNMATGRTSADSLFVNGQLKVSGNISKGHDLVYLLGPAYEE